MRWAVLLLSTILLSAFIPEAAAQPAQGQIVAKRLLFTQVAVADISTVTPVAFNYTGPAHPNVTQLDWDLGDGTRFTRMREANRSSFQVAFADLHRYKGEGDYVVRVVVRDGDRVLDNVTTTIQVRAPPAFPPLSSSLYWLMPMAAGLILLGLAILVLTRGQPVVYNRVFFLLYATSALKSFAEGGLFLTDDPSLDAVFAPINSLAGYFLITLFLWFVFVFPRPVFHWLKDGKRGAVFLLLGLPFVLNYLLGLFPPSFLSVYFNVYVSVAALLALGVLVYHAWETDSDEERNRIRLLSASFFLLVFSTIVTAGLLVLANSAPTTHEALYYLGWNYVFALIVAPALELLGSMILMYAILRYQLLGIEVFVKRVTRATLFALMVGSTFVIISNTVEEIVQNRFLGEVPLAFIIAGFISTISMYPVQKITERFANRLFPLAGSNAPDYMAQRRMEIYEAQLRYALLDGQLKQKELTMLHALRDSLGIGMEELRKVASLFPGLDSRALLPRGMPAASAAAPIRPTGPPPASASKARRPPPRH